jgi:hypothetical protein
MALPFPHDRFDAAVMALVISFLFLIRPKALPRWRGWSAPAVRSGHTRGICWAEGFPGSRSKSKCALQESRRRSPQALVPREWRRYVTCGRARDWMPSRHRNNGATNIRRLADFWTATTMAASIRPTLATMPPDDADQRPDHRPKIARADADESVPDGWSGGWVTAAGWTAKPASSYDRRATAITARKPVRSDPGLAAELMRMRL